MRVRLAVIGAGGFGREVIDVVDALNAAGADWAVEVADDSPSRDNLDRLASRGVPFVGTIADLVAVGPCAYVIGIGNPSVRRVVAERLDSVGFRAVSLIHPTATFGFSVQVGAGSVICAGARLTTNIALGRHVHINLNSTVGHDTKLGDYVSINPLAAISGDCVLEDEVLVGTGAAVINLVRVGRASVVGASSCVVRNVGAGVTVKGVPAR